MCDYRKNSEHRVLDAPTSQHLFAHAAVSGRKDMNLFVPKLLLSFEWMHPGIQIKGVTSLIGHSDCNSCLWIQAYLKKLKSTELTEHMYGKSGKKLLKTTSLSECVVFYSSIIC